MTLIACWLLFPIVLSLLSAGLGLLVERVAGAAIRTSLLLPCGFALLVVITSLATLSAGTAPLATPAAVVLAVAGFAVAARRHRWGMNLPAIAAVLGVFAVAAAPVVLTGQASFAGYTQLDDISTFLGLASYAIDHGRDVAGVPPSTFEATLSNLTSGYPIGSFIPLAAARPLVGQDLAWLWQPYLTYTLGLLALALWALAAPVMRKERLRALVVFVAAQPALLYAYTLQGGVKELVAAVLLALAAALGSELVREPGRGRLALPLGVAGAALLCTLNVGAAAYALPLLVALAVAAALAHGGRPHKGTARRSPRRLAAIGAGLTAAVVLVVVVLSSSSSFISGGGLLLKNSSDIGNLFHPLDWKQLFGIWPSGDFRNGIGDGREIALGLIAVLAAAALLGAVCTLRRRLVGPLLFAAATLGALIGLATFGSSPWVDAKALAIASPAVLLVALVGAALLVESSRLRALGAVALALIAGGVAWSNWLAYHDVKLAPRDRLAELATIGDRFAGGGPTLINEYEPYGARYFLRRLDPEAPAELRRRLVPLRSGVGLGKTEWAPLDEFLLAPILVYRTIVVRRSPAEARPPAEYSLRWSGRYYDVWQRPDPPRATVLPYSIFGTLESAGALPPCPLVRQLGAAARSSGAQLAAAVRAPAVIGDLGRATHPRSWAVAPGPPAHLYPDSPGSARLAMSVAAAGPYDAWVEGSFARGLELYLDGSRVGSTRDELSFPGQWIRFGVRTLAPGSHRVELRYPGASLRPGSGQQYESVGPVAFAPRSPRPELLHVAPANAGTLCAKPLDWIEVVAP